MTKTGQPRPLDNDELRELLALISSRHGVDYALVGEMRGGDGPGAWELESSAGLAVLKVIAGRDATADLELRAKGVDVLRGRAYPAPEFLCIGRIDSGTYLVQERLPGDPVGASFTDEHLDEILRLNELHAGIGVALPGDEWPLPVTRPVLEGSDGFCVIETMRAYSSETDALLTELQDMTRQNMDGITNTGDLVHFDFTFANILADDGRISGVIDLDAAMVGDRSFDLAAFLFYAWDNDHAREVLWSRARDISGAPALRTYFAHLMFRQVEWCTRFYGGDLVRHYLDLSRTILGELARL